MISPFCSFFSVSTFKALHTLFITQTTLNIGIKPSFSSIHVLLHPDLIQPPLL